jgi:hypothetical protein
MCSNLTIAGYSDWYLPSKDELNKMYLNIGQGNALGLGNIGGFIESHYWSSTKYSDQYTAWSQYFNGGLQSNSSRSGLNYVRAIRSF